jgi:hypothetical protein
MEELRDDLRSALADYKAALSDSMTAGLLIGKLAIRAKAALAHGEFDPWLRVNFESSVIWIRTCVRAKKASDLGAKATSIEKMAAMLRPLEGKPPIVVPRRASAALTTLKALRARVAYLESKLDAAGIRY